MTLTLEDSEGAVRPEPDEAESLHVLSKTLGDLVAARRPAMLTGPQGEVLRLPDSVFRTLKVVVEQLAQGNAITVIPQEKELTTQEAADLLHVSRPHLITLLESGDIPFHKVGTHRRVRFADLVTFRQTRANTRRKALTELTRLSEDLPGGYR